MNRRISRAALAVAAAAAAAVAAAAVAAAALGGCGSSNSPRRTGIACGPFFGDVLDAPPGSHCDSGGDCQAGACYCTDGTSDTAVRSCHALTCDPDYACEELCTTHGGPAACPDAG